jgi:hypothetical protein
MGQLSGFVYNIATKPSAILFTYNVHSPPLNIRLKSGKSAINTVQQAESL